MLMQWSGFDRSFSALEDLRRRMDRLFDGYSGYLEEVSSSGIPWAWTTWPRTELRDEGDHLSLHAEVPGMSEKEIQLSLNENVLSISGERKVEGPEGYSVHRQERGSVKFNRSFTLPCRVDPEKSAAMVKKGVLSVTLEKAVEAKPRQIAVKAS